MCPDDTFLDGLTCLDECPPNKYPEADICVEECSPGYFLDSDNVCSKCLPNCEECVSTLTCKTCFETYYLHQSECLISCPEEFVENNELRSCLPCGPNCKNCSPDNVLWCTECYETWKLHQQDCYEGCLWVETLESSGECSSCLPEYVLYGGDCLTGCPAKT